MLDLQVIAFQSDLSRVSTIMFGREGSVRTYPEIGVSDPHHPLTHHRGHPDFIERVTKINCLHAELFAYFLERLKSTQDGAGSLLDRSAILYGSALSDGNSHSSSNLPLLVARRRTRRTRRTPLRGSAATRRQPVRRPAQSRGHTDRVVRRKHGAARYGRYITLQPSGATARTMAFQGLENHDSGERRPWKAIVRNAAEVLRHFRQRRQVGH